MLFCLQIPLRQHVWLSIESFFVFSDIFRAQLNLNTLVLNVISMQHKDSIGDITEGIISPDPVAR